MADDRSARGRETVTAFFESRTQAQAALDRLRYADVPVDEARLYEGDDEIRAVDREGHLPDRETRRKGFWEQLGDLFLPHEDRGTYAEGLSRGGTVLSVPVAADHRARVVDILDDEGTVDIDERQSTWRSEGWGGPAASPLFGDGGAIADHGEADLRGGLSGIGGQAAGAAPGSYARRDESLVGRRVRSYRMDEPGGEASRLSDVEIEDERRVREDGLTGTTGRSILDR